MTKEKLKQAIFITLLVFFSTLAICSDEKASLKIQNIEVFSRLYGYVKYFYPGDEAADTDWDRFAIYGVKQVENARDRAELKKTLEQLFLPVAPALVIHKSKKKAKFSLAAITPPDTKNKKVIVWQHLGVGFGNPQSTYRSIRLNRQDPQAFKFSFGPLANYIDAAPYRGKTIKLKAAVKVSAGIGQLWLRAVVSNKQVALLADMDENPIQSNQWNTYEITAPVPDDAVKIYYGCFLGGSGQLWADDFLLYTSPEGTGNQQQWTPITIKNPGFEEDKEGSAPGGWAAKSDLYSFSVTTATAAKGRKSVTIKSTAPPVAKPLFREKPGIGEYIAKELGCGLSCLMPIALYGTGDFTFPRSRLKKRKNLETAVNQELTRGKDPIGSDQYERLAGIVITWNVLRHFYPYVDNIKIDWETALTEGLESAYQDKSPLDFLETLNHMTAHLKDGQGGAYLAGNTSRMYLPPFNWDWVQGQLVITEVYDNNLTDVGVGDIVVEIDDIKAGQALEIKERSISGATAGWIRSRALEELLRGKEKSIIHLKIKRDKPNVFYHETVSRSAFSPKYYSYLEKRKKPSREIEKGIYYLNLDITTMPEINRLMPELQKARGIICDLRGAPKGSHPLIGHLLTEKKTSKWMWIPRVIYPDYEKVTYKKVGWTLEPLKPFLTAKMVFITNNSTIDYAESILSYIEHFQLGTIVGQPTAGTNGEINSFYLLGRFLVRWTGAKAVKLDGSPYHGVGIAPHVRVERTFEGIKQGRDEFLEKAIEIAKME